MDNYKQIKLLGEAFANGAVDDFAPYIAEGCYYHSDYAKKTLNGRDRILKSMTGVYADRDSSDMYYYRVEELDAVTLDTIPVITLSENPDKLGKYCLVLSQYSPDKTVAIVLTEQDDNGQVSRIELSRRRNTFRVNFYDDFIGEDSALDLPSTVTPISREDRHRKELQNAFSGQGLKDGSKGDARFYIWRQADVFFRQWLKNNGYEFDHSAVFEDCIGYRCVRKGLAYTIFMFARGLTDTANFSEERLRHLAKHSFSKDSTVLVTYLRSKRVLADGEYRYSVCWYTGNENQHVELWKITRVSGQTILEYFPRQELDDITLKLMYAYNRESLDVYDSIIVDRDPHIKCLDYPGYSVNDAFYHSLQELHQKYGDMKFCYCRVNNSRVYCGLPYIPELGCIGFSVYPNDNDRIHNIDIYPFDPSKFNGFEYSESKISDIIWTNYTEDPEMYSHIPKLLKAVPLPPVQSERFAVKLYFDNGECRKYVLPINRANEADEAVHFDRHVFTDRIWASVEVVEHREPKYSGYPECGQGLAFTNGYNTSVLRCYEESCLYSEPSECNDLVYNGDAYALRRILTWNVNSFYEDEETGLYKVLERGTAFNYYGVSTFASPDGKRLTSLDFDYIDNFSEGLARVAVQGYGYGYVDRTLRFVIPMKYDDAEDFVNGKAKVRLGDKWFFIDKDGKETPLVPAQLESKYEEVCNYSEGRCRVSTLKLRLMDIAYHSDYSDIAGNWGYVDESGKEVIPPQFIYAYDFENGLAVVCKGTWTIDPKWDYEGHTGQYWHDEELWGAIDKDGNEVIPCIFDEIKFFHEGGAFMVHSGGWERGRWGVIDCKGNWLADPVFKAIDYEFHDGLFAFYSEDPWDYDDAPIGIYDTKQKRVLFEPQFSDVSFRDDGYIEVEVYDEALGRTVEKLIDRNGNEKFHSEYSSIYTWSDPYEVVIRDKDGTSRHGLIDMDGNVLLPCKFHAAWGGISYEHQFVVFEEDKKKGLQDFNGNVILPAEYSEIYWRSGPLLIVRVGDSGNQKYGLIARDGTTILPVVYDGISHFKGDKYICRIDGHCEILLLEIK